ncbi:MAG: histidine kinase [Wenzhouxiangella sp.]|nr:MAG: histidine kinase [Wenzhouxiangella sp.]
MSMTRIHFTQQIGLESLKQLVDQALAEDAQALMLLACDANGCSPDSFDPWLRSLPVPVFGGVFPQLIHAGRNVERGYLVIALSEPVRAITIAGLSDPETDFHEQVAEQLGDDEPPDSVLFLLDGLASRIGELLDVVYDHLGSDTVYFGGGAGSLSFEPRPCLFSNQGMLADHAQLTILPGHYELGVEHGWEKLAGPFVVTDATRNVIHALDFRPAFEVYREHVEPSSGQRFEQDNFFAIAKAYPFGLEKPDGHILVRDPISRTGNDLNCVGEVPANSMVYLLKGDPEKLIAAAGRGARNIPPGQAPAILADCISRVLFLEDDFARELAAIQSGLGDRPVFGMLTLGEVANGGGTCLEFYNKTSVLAAPSD